MEDPERKIQRETPLGGSCLDTLRRFFDRVPASRMKTDLDVEDSRSSEGSGPATRPRQKGKEKTPERRRRPAQRHPHDSDPFVTCSHGDGEDRRHRQESTGCKVGVPAAGGGGGNDTLPGLGVRVLHLTTAVRKAPPADPRRNPEPNGETGTPMRTWESAQMPTHPAAEDPRMADRRGPQAEDRPGDCREEGHLVDPLAEGPQTEDLRRTTRRILPLRTAAGGHPQEHLAMDRVPQEEDLEPGARGADQQDRDGQECRSHGQGPEGAEHRQVRG